jgi:hypothetical protein
MRYWDLLPGFVLTVLLVPAGAAWAGAANTSCVAEVREVDLPHVCKGGSNNNGSCTVQLTDVATCKLESADCPGGKCELNFAPGSCAGTLTFIVDENVSIPSNSQSNRQALTALVEIQKKGRHLLAETYQADDPENSPGFERFEDISELDTNAEQLLLLQPASELAAGLRDVCEQTGTPVIVKTKKSAFFDDDASFALGSVQRIGITIRFLP